MIREAFGDNKAQAKPQKGTLQVEGHDFFEFMDWCEPTVSSVNWIDSFFFWKRIADSEEYFRFDFGRLAPLASEFYYREANAQGVNSQDFVKVIATVAHFVERAASGYPPKGRTEVATVATIYGTKKDFRSIPFGEIYQNALNLWLRWKAGRWVAGCGD